MRRPGPVGLLAALLVVLLAGCQVRVQRIPKPEPLSTLRVGEVRRVSDRVATSDVSWSPDGQTVAFGTPEGVISAGRDGTERRLSPLRPATQVDWSSSGRWLAVISGGGLWLVDLSRSATRAASLPGVVRAFRWSPAGDRGVAVVEQDGWWLWLVSADGRLRRRIFGPASGLFDLGWYPNGLEVFVREEDASGKTVALWRVRVAGSDRRREVPSFPSVVQAQLSTTGRAVAYLVAEEEGVAVVLQEVGHRPRPPLAQAGKVWGLSWSPQGDKLSYAEVEGGERASVWVVDADGSTRLLVADYALEFPDPNSLVGTGWSPDGRAVAFGTGFSHRAGPVWVARLYRR